ncbi:hypothetical protein RRG08_015165 [Elysia crispata]|uniref:Uncharacterized protein n=1 Tax=Elysia crispata TaxID=231223 RepID=A0AAE1E7L1_9GAST|nr:hypothetical protein RRG08_015165 [Elysia crispata]
MFAEPSADDLGCILRECSAFAGQFHVQPVALDGQFSCVLCAEGHAFDGPAADARQLQAEHNIDVPSNGSPGLINRHANISATISRHSPLDESLDEEFCNDHGYDPHNSLVQFLVGDDMDEEENDHTYHISGAHEVQCPMDQASNDDLESRSIRVPDISFTQSPYDQASDEEFDCGSHSLSTAWLPIDPACEECGYPCPSSTCAAQLARDQASDELHRGHYDAAENSATDESCITQALDRFDRHHPNSDNFATAHSLMFQAMVEMYRAVLDCSASRISAAIQSFVHQIGTELNKGHSVGPPNAQESD